MTTTQTPAPAQPVTTCPPSDVHDMIVRLDQVQTGDLVLWDGELAPVESIEPHPAAPSLRYVKLPGWPFPGCFRSDRYTAVRRYTEGLVTIPAQTAQAAAAALDENADDRSDRAGTGCRDCAEAPGRYCEGCQESLQRAGEYREARDELLEACRG